MAATPSVSPAPMSHAISKDDHGPLVSIATCLMLAGMVLFLFIRMGIRWPWRQLIGLDDAMMVIGSALAVGYSVAVFRAVHYGLGRFEEDLSPSEIEEMEKQIYAGDLLFVVSMTASKMAVALLLFRLSSVRRTILASYGLMGVIGAWGIASLLAVAIRPQTSRPWTLNSEDASHVMDIWTGVGTISILIEIGLLIFPAFLVWTLQMPVTSKLTVIAAFGFRLPVAIIAILRIVAFRRAFGDSPANISWTFITLTVYTSIEVHFSLIAATIPCMHVFLKNFNTGYLGTTADQVDNITATMAATKGSNSYVMSTVRSRHTQNSNSDNEGKGGKPRGDLRLRPSDGMNTSRVVHRERGVAGAAGGSGDAATDTGSVDSDGSDKIMVRKTVDVKWDRDGSSVR